MHLRMLKCSKCGTDEYTRIPVRRPQPDEIGSLPVRRPAEYVRKRRTEMLGDT